MKYIIITLLILISSGLRAQDTLVSYIDIKGKKIKKRHAVFTKKVWSDNHKLWTVEIASLSGQIKEIKHYGSEKLKERTGAYISFYKNGSKRSEGEYNKGKKWSCYIYMDNTCRRHSSLNYLSPLEYGRLLYNQKRAA